jgi:ornithine carbamoyltransferase
MQYAKATSSKVVEVKDLRAVPKELDVVYTTRWQTTGTIKIDPDWRNVFNPYRVSSALMDNYPNALFLHDLPAHRGEEVDADVLDSSKSRAFQQAENKMHSAAAIYQWCLG